MNSCNDRIIFSILQFLLCAFIIDAVSFPVAAQAEKTADNTTKSATSQRSQLTGNVNIKPVADDEEIDKRLTEIMAATGWFPEFTVQVDQGVVFLDGYTDLEDRQSWAGELAGKTMDVVAVVNRIQVVDPSPWDFTPAFNELDNIRKATLKRLPRFGLGFAVLILAGLLIKLVVFGLRKILNQRLNPLLRSVVARLTSIFLFLLGFYLALQVAGLSGLSATILGGTGLAGLVAGIAFRDLLENYLASILISIRNPFKIDDLVEISQHLGVVERVTTRGTILMNQDGNHVQIPNAIVYKSIIRNYTANPNRREMIEVGIGFESKASHAQEIALKILSDHPAVLAEPELLVLVDRLGSATVNMRIYFWYDGSIYNGLKVKSSLIRLVKQSFEEQGISMPDEARERLFPEGVPVRMIEQAAAKETEGITKDSSPDALLSEKIATDAEGGLASEAGYLRDQARSSRNPEEGESLII